jgi:hypothetical protein
MDSLSLILSSHPLPADRESQIRGEMTRFPPRAGLVRNNERFAAAQAELKRLPRQPPS